MKVRAARFRRIRRLLDGRGPAGAVGMAAGTLLMAAVLTGPLLIAPVTGQHATDVGPWLPMSRMLQHHHEHRPPPARPEVPTAAVVRNGPLRRSRNLLPHARHGQYGMLGPRPSTAPGPRPPARPPGLGPTLPLRGAAEPGGGPGHVWHFRDGRHDGHLPLNPWRNLQCRMLRHDC